MAEEQVKTGAAQAGVEAGSHAAETAAQTGERDASQAQEKVLTLTEKELRALLDREVQKALKTRTSNLEREKAELEAKLQEAAKLLEESQMSVEERLKARETELKSLAQSAKNLQKQLEALHREVQDIVEAEIASLSEEDRMLVDGILDDSMNPLTKLRILRALRNAGKISSTPKPPKEEPKALGGVMRPASGPATTPNRFLQLFEAGKKLASRKGQGEGVMPEEWKGR